MGILLLVWLSSFGQAGLAWPDRDPVVLHVRAYADSRVDKATVSGAGEVARRLLAAGGLKTEWRSCDTAESCPVARGVLDAVVRLSLPSEPGRTERCGQAALGDRPGAGTVTVSVPCVAAVASRLSRPGDGPWPPTPEDGPLRRHPWRRDRPRARPPSGPQARRGRHGPPPGPRANRTAPEGPPRLQPSGRGESERAGDDPSAAGWRRSQSGSGQTASPLRTRPVASVLRRRTCAY